MNITINVLGIELVRITIDLGDLVEVDASTRLTKIDKGVKGMSNWWVKRMNK